MPDNSTIGRDSSCSCSIMLPGREVSRLHARVFFSQREVITETVSKINDVTINGMGKGSRVQVGKEILVWQREGGKHGEDISEDTLWGEKDEAVFGNEEVKEDDVDAIEHSKDSGSDRKSSHVL